MRALNLVGPINSSGYGIVGFNLVRALDAMGVELSLFVTGGQEFPELRPSLSDLRTIRLALRRQQLFPVNAPCLRIAPEFNMTLFAGRGLRAGLSFFETDALSEREVHHLGALDLIVVPSQWAADVIGASPLAGSRVAVVPMGVDSTIFRPAEPPAETPHETVFLHVGKWEQRKGQDFVLEAFAAAFDPDDEVRLELMCDNPLLGERNREWQDVCRRSPLAERIRILPRAESQADVAQRMRAADCGFFPTRAEGWNLELLEMMACDKPVIATDYSAHTEFVTADNCHRIAIDRLEDAVDSRYHQLYGREKSGRWAHLGPAQLEQAVEHLRAIHRAKQDGATLSNAAGVQTARELSWNNSATVLAEALGI